MAVPTSIADLDVTAANNSPSGSEPVGTNLDNYLRAHASIIKQVSETLSAVNPSSVSVNSSSAAITITQSGAGLAVDAMGGIKTSRTAVTAPAASDGNVFSGSYTPTITNGTNVASSISRAAYYMRVGNVVTLTFSPDITPTSTGGTVYSFSIPVASNFASTTQAGGVSFDYNNNQIGAVSADTVNDRISVSFIATSTTLRTHRMTITYVVA